MPSDRIRKFYDSESFAIIGISRTRKNFSRMVYDSLSALGKRVYAVGPQSGHFDGLEIYDSLRSLSEKPQAIIIGTKPEKALSVLDEVAASGADYIWLQQGCYDKHVLAMVDRMGIDAIKGCAMMYMPGTAFLHRMHRTFAELLGGGYK